MSEWLLGTVALGALAQSAVAQDLEPAPLPEIRVIATTPIVSGGRPRAPAPVRRTGPVRGPVTPVAAPVVSDPTVIDRDKVPSSTSTVTPDDIQRSHSLTVTETLAQRVPGVFTTDIQGNGFVQDLSYRGFTASALQGTPQGLAIYMNGIRVNEAFGDTVNWDLIPTNAIARADVWSSNPIFGLNALGGAVSLQMKTGFSYQGAELELLSGSYGRMTGAAQYGAQYGNFAVYLAAQGLDDKGWRYQSPSAVGRLYTDFGWKDDRTELHFVATIARNNFGVIGPTPVQLLARDYASIYTWPQITKNEVELFSVNGKHALTNSWTIQGNLYLRRFRQAHVDGNDANVERCSGVAANPLFNTLCLEDDGFPPPVPAKVNFQILGPNNQPISCPPGPGNQCALTPYGTIDRTITQTNTYGGTLQASNNDKIFGHDNQFTVGGSIDRSAIGFNAASELGYIYPNLLVAPNPAIPGNGLIIHTFGNIGYGPVALDAANTYYGLYATDTFDVTDRLSLTVGGRYNLATIAMQDRLGTSPELNTDIAFHRFNPVAGATYKIVPGLSAYGGYAEANRAPTPLELGCANPARPCLLEGFLVSDPPLRQVVSKTFEAGLRGERQIAGGRVEWKVGAFRADSTNDIIQVASQIQGRGVFQNVEGTRRQGVEAGAQYQSPQWLIYANYAFIDATYQFTGTLASPNNPLADADGNIFVTPGKRIPMIPQHQFKAGADYSMTPEWKVGGDLHVVGSQYFVGDGANQNAPLPAYWQLNLHTSYQVQKSLQLFALVNNVFNRKYGLYGTFFEPRGVRNVPLGITLTDQRMVTPAQPLSVYAGLRWKM